MMGEFFRGWKRKIGLLTLLMALVAMAGWVRTYSTSTPDVFMIPSEHGSDWFVSSNSGLVWGSVNSDVPLATTPQTIQSVGTEVLGIILRDGDDADIEGWIWECSGLGIGEFSLRTLNGEEFGLNVSKIPYWSIVVPLTALSAWLLITKPRKSTQTKNDEPIPIEGA